MSITHEYARKLVQLNMDQNLNAEESAIVFTHLRGCSECTAYARDIKEVASILTPMMKRQWNVQPIPLSLSKLNGYYEKKKSSAFLTMRKVAVTFVAMALFFSAWQFVLSSPSPSSNLSSAIPPIPTPSSPTMQTISTHLIFGGCAMLSYKVEENDTLASIAEQFMTSEGLIMEFNQLETDIVSPSMELFIPVCNFTPTGTFHPATFANTHTPLARPTTSTPEG